jgi:hypothetical protein
VDVLKISKLYLILVNVPVLVLKFFFPEYYPFSIAVFAVSGFVFGMMGLVRLNTISIYVFEKYPRYYNQIRTITLGTQCNLVSSESLFHVKDEVIKADTDLMEKVADLKSFQTLVGICFVLFLVYALLSFV